MIGTVRSSVEFTGRPLAMRNWARNGAPRVDAPDMSADWLPRLTMSTQIFAVWPTRTEPKLTRDGTEMNLVTGRRPAPDSVTVTLVPLLLVTVNEPGTDPGCAGANRTWTGIAAPGLMTVPGAGRPAAVYGPVGALTEVT